MSAIADLPSRITVERPLLARWIEAWSRLDRHHLLGLAVAILLMSAVDVSTLAGKFGRPGVLTVLAFDLFSTVVLFSVTLLAWSAAVEGHAPHGSRRFRALAAAVLVSGLASAAIVVPVGAAADIFEIWWELMGKKKELPPMWLAIARQHRSSRLLQLPVRHCDRGPSKPGIHERSRPCRAARAVVRDARGAGIAAGRNAGAGRTAVPVQLAGRHRGPVPEGRARGRREPGPSDPVPARRPAPAA